MFQFYMGSNINFTDVDYSEIVKDQAMIQALITDMINHPRNFTLGGNDAWLDGNAYTKQWESVMNSLQAQFALENLTQ